MFPLGQPHTLLHFAPLVHRCYVWETPPVDTSPLNHYGDQKTLAHPTTVNAIFEVEVRAPARKKPSLFVS